MLGTSYNQSSPSSPSTCYFSLPTSTRTSIDSEDTPFASPLEPFTLPETPSDPNHPLLALRNEITPRPTRSSRMDASKFLSLQTSAAYGSRPQPQPVQNGQQTVESTSTDSTSSSDSDTLASSLARCSRCHRSVSTGSSSGIVSFGTNLYYCSRCASLVGYTNR